MGNEPTDNEPPASPGDRPPERGNLGDIMANARAIVRALGPARVEIVTSEFTGQEMVQIQPLPPPPLTRRNAALYASLRLKERTALRVRRTDELTREGRTRKEIGEIIGSEESREPFPVGTVKGWRRRAVGYKPSG